MRDRQKRIKSLHLNFEKGLFLLNAIYDSIKNRKYSRINLTKEVENLYAENCKRKIKEDLNKWRIHCPWTIRLNIKMSVLQGEGIAQW